jgi:hypothetical protein
VNVIGAIKGEADEFIGSTELRFSCFVADQLKFGHNADAHSVWKAGVVA